MSDMAEALVLPSELDRLGWVEVSSPGGLTAASFELPLGEMGELGWGDILYVSPGEIDIILPTVSYQEGSYYGYTWAGGGGGYGGGYLGGSGGGGGGGGYDSNTNDGDEDTGSNDPNYVQTLNHYQTCGTDDGAAVQIANTIKATDDVYGPILFDWKGVEYSAVVVKNSDGSFGAMNSTIYTLGEKTFSSVPMPDQSAHVMGIVHNHPDALGEQTEDLRQRYPSGGAESGDWNALQRLYDRYIGSRPGYDPSVWIVDAWGVMREFKLSERAYFESLTPTQVQDGVGLEGKERNTSCSSS